MSTKTDFTAMSVANGLRRKEFAALPAATKKKLIRLMARISEASFRRGLQHGAATGGDALPVRPGLNLAKYRFLSSLDVSRSPHGKLKHTAVERLQIEYAVLRDIGLL